MKRVMKLAVALGLVLGLSKGVMAQTSELLTVTIQPNAFYSLLIDTDTGGLNLGQVNLSASTQTVLPATVTINSTFATTDIRLDGVIASAGTPWTFDDDTTSIEGEKLATWATFSAVTHTTAPAQGGEYFAGTTPGDAASDVVDTTNQYVGTGGGSTDKYEVTAGTHLIQMDGQAISAESHLWLFFRMPSSSITSDPQLITITLTAVQPL